ILSQGNAVAVMAEQLRRLAIKAENVLNQPVKTGLKQIAALGKQAIEITARIFKTGGFAVDAETHFGFLFFDTQFGQHVDKIGIGFFIEDNKTRVHIDRPALNLQLMGMGMAAEMVSRFKNCQVMTVLELPHQRIAGNTRAYNGNFHGDVSSVPAPSKALLSRVLITGR